MLIKTKPWASANDGVLGEEGTGARWERFRKTAASHGQGERMPSRAEFREVRGHRLSRIQSSQVYVPPTAFKSPRKKKASG